MFLISCYSLHLGASRNAYFSKQIRTTAEKKWVTLHASSGKCEFYVLFFQEGINIYGRSIDRSGRPKTTDTGCIYYVECGHLIRGCGGAADGSRDREQQRTGATGESGEKFKPGATRISPVRRAAAAASASRAVGAAVRTFGDAVRTSEFR